MTHRPELWYVNPDDPKGLLLQVCDVKYLRPKYDCEIFMENNPDNLHPV